MQLVERGGRITARWPIDERVLRYAPLLRFTRDELYFPIDPATFVEKALLRRYGWSEEVRDAVWHPRRSCWESAPAGLPASADALGPDLNEACRLIQFEARGTEAGFNRRPCDAKNLWHGRRAGYALELAQPLSDYSMLLRSWRLEPRRVAAMSWSCFDGAWGRVGGGPRTTGPLGPLFRRESAATIARSVAFEPRP